MKIDRGGESDVGRGVCVCVMQGGWGDVGSGGGDVGRERGGERLPWIKALTQTPLPRNDETKSRMAVSNNSSPCPGPCPEPDPFPCPCPCPCPDPDPDPDPDPFPCPGSDTCPDCCSNCNNALSFISLES